MGFCPSHTCNCSSPHRTLSPSTLNFCYHPCFLPASSSPYFFYYTIILFHPLQICAPHLEFPPPTSNFCIHFEFFALFKNFQVDGPTSKLFAPPLHLYPGYGLPSCDIKQNIFVNVLPFLVIGTLAVYLTLHLAHYFGRVSDIKVLTSGTVNHLCRC